MYLSKCLNEEEDRIPLSASPKKMLTQLKPNFNFKLKNRFRLDYNVFDWECKESLPHLRINLLIVNILE